MEKKKTSEKGEQLFALLRKNFIEQRTLRIRIIDIYSKIKEYYAYTEIMRAIEGWDIKMTVEHLEYNRKKIKFLRDNGITEEQLLTQPWDILVSKVKERNG